MIPKTTAYVVQFGGFATEERLLTKAAELAGAAKVRGPTAWAHVRMPSAFRCSLQWPLMALQRQINARVCGDVSRRLHLLRTG